MVLAPVSRLDPASRGVLARFSLKLLLLAGFGVLGRLQGVSHSLMFLSLLAALLSGAQAIWYRDTPKDGSLNHWDEAMAFFGLCYIVRFASAAFGG
jgi:hypothetical protein